MIKVGVVSLGCDKNRCDTEVMLKKLSTEYQITAEPTEADVIVVNTCAFLESARKEAIDTVLEMSELKKNGAKIVVTGCLGQKFGKEVFDGLTEADAILGTCDYDQICDVIEKVVGGERCYCVSPADKITHGERILTTPSHFAYLKIADGCDNFCTYCLIPHIRGRFRSLPTETLVSEAKSLAEKGVKELILVAQDTTRYGVDLYGSLKIVELVRALSQIDGINRLRLLYCYPEMMTDELIAEIAKNDKVAKCVDVPLQHVSDGILHKMNRRSNKQSIVKLFDLLAQNGIDVRSTFICGFPGENDQTADELAEFLQTYKLRNVGFFAYSAEPGTPAANFDGQLTSRKKQSLVKRMYKVQHAVVAERNASDVGKVFAVMIDDFVEDNADGYVYVGRTDFQAPEIDGVVYVYSKTALSAGDVVDVKITDALEYDLIGDVVDK